MSDTAAFLAGCAVTGVAVLFVMRNDFAGSQTRVPSSVQPPSPTPEMSTMPVPVPPQDSSRDDGRSFRMETELDQQRDLSRDLTDQLRRQQDRTEDLKNQLEKQQSETEDLKNQLEKQQRNTELLISQIQEQQRMLDRVTDRSLQSTMPVSSSSDTSSADGEIKTIIIGAVGIVVLIVVAGGGLVLFAIVIVVLLSSRRRPARTVHIVHPIPNPYASFQPQPLLPSRTRTKPARQIDVEYYSDDYDR